MMSMSVHRLFLLVAVVSHGWWSAECFAPTRTTLHSARTSPSPTESISTLYAAKNGEDATNLVSLLQQCTMTDPSFGRSMGVLDGLFGGGSSWSPSSFLDSIFNQDSSASTPSDNKILLVICPQLGDFETWEYAEQLVNCLPELQESKIQVRLIGIGNVKTAQKFSQFTGFPLENMGVDPTASIHQALQLHKGPDWDIPSWTPAPLLSWFKDYVGASADADETLLARAWLNYMAMCAGVAAPDTLPEIFRGYVGDQTAPERLAANEVVRVGNDDIVIRGTTDVKLGPIEYQSLWKNEKGYQRPAELATVRLRGMVEILTHMNEYVPDQTLVDWRGATFLFECQNQSGNANDFQLLYEHRDTGVLAYSKTMPRPLTFLEPYIGAKALNPLNLGDRYMESLDERQGQEQKERELAQV